MATKISLKQLGDDVLVLLGGGGSLAKDITSNVTVGAANSGTKFPQGQTLTEFAEMLLVKELIPTISTSFSGTGVKEVGTTVNGSTMVLKITNTPSASITINKIEFFVGNTLLDSQPYISGTNTYQFNYTNSITTNTTLKAVLTYNGNKTLSGSGSFDFVYGSFYGPTSVSSIDTTIAEGLIAEFTKSIKNTKALTWSDIALNDERFCYMYPVSMGALSSIKDGNGFDQTNGYTRYQVNITYPSDGQTVSYYVYLLNDSVTGNGFKQIYS